MRYISDIFGEKEISSLEIGDSVAIWSQTGSGKSYLIKNVISKHCLEKNLKCLLISNRKILRNQNEKDLRLTEYGDAVDTINYQGLEVKFNGDIKVLFSGYDFIVFDEVHYLLNDSEFNRNTDILLGVVKNPPKDKICIYMTATPEALEFCGIKPNKIYTLPNDYSYIENVFFYSKESTLNEILNSIPYGEKAMYFCSTAADAYKKSKDIGGASFICSENNRNFYAESSMQERANIIARDKFDSKILCCTKVLDNGVNIKDSSVKHIIIDILDPITFVQCLGRKRVIFDDDKISLYIKAHPVNQINFVRKKYEDKLAIADELILIGREAFVEKYKKRSLDDIIDNDMTVNQAKYYYYQFMVSELKKMCEIGYIQYICKKIGCNHERIENAESFFEKKTLKNVLEFWTGKKIFSEEQEKFKEDFFGRIFETKSRSYRRRGLKSINAIMEEDGVDYVLVSSRETAGENRNKRYWQLIKY